MVHYFIMKLQKIMETRLEKSPVVDMDKLLIDLEDSGAKDGNQSSDTSSATEHEDNVNLSDKDDTVDEEAKKRGEDEKGQQITEYIVDARDTLNSIAAKHDTTPAL